MAQMGMPTNNCFYEEFPLLKKKTLSHGQAENVLYSSIGSMIASQLDNPYDEFDLSRVDPERIMASVTLAAQMIGHAKLQFQNALLHTNCILLLPPLKLGIPATTPRLNQMISSKDLSLLREEKKESKRVPPPPSSTRRSHPKRSRPAHGGRPRSRPAVQSRPQFKQYASQGSGRVAARLRAHTRPEARRYATGSNYQRKSFPGTHKE